MDYSIKIDAFEGPLDLLLHLIKKDNIKIIDIDIDKITKQYLDYINKMEELNIDVASAYLVMASELLEIKSISLLPNTSNTVLEEDEEVDNANTKEKLIERLLEYEKYKNITSTFRDLEDTRSEIFIKSPENRHNYTETVLTNELGYDANSLYNAFMEFLKRKNMEKPITTKVATKEYSIKKRTSEIRGLLTIRKQVKFRELFDNFNKDYVVTFLSILDMAKNKELTINQSNNFEEITLKLRGSEEDE